MADAARPPNRLTTGTVVTRVSVLLLAGLGALIFGSVLASTHAIVLFDPSPDFAREWRHHVFEQATEYTFAVIDGQPAVRAVGRRSASGLFKSVSYSLKSHPWLEWSWRVDRLQATADLRIVEKHDFGAGMMLLFERPNWFSREILTLNYIWASERHAPDTVLENPHAQSKVRHVIVRAGPHPLGAWVIEKRNVVEDFRRAFGREPPDDVQVIALFTDNDQTGEPVEAGYGAIRALAF
jgi:hypothetical protein